MWIFAENRDPHRTAAMVLEEGRGKRKGIGQKGRVSVGRQEAMAPAAPVYTDQQWSKRTERLGEREISSDRTGTSVRFCSQPSGA